MADNEELLFHLSEVGISLPPSSKEFVKGSASSIIANNYVSYFGHANTCLLVHRQEVLYLFKSFYQFPRF